MKKEKLMAMLTDGHVKTSKDKPTLIEKDETCFFDIITRDYIIAKNNSSYAEYLDQEWFRTTPLFIEPRE